MELTDEKKRQILEEEHARIVEEQYREQVRATLRTANVNAPPMPIGSSGAVERISTWHRIRLFVLCTLLAIVFCLFLRRISQNSSDRGERSTSLLHPFSKPLVSGDVIVPALQARYWTFSTTSSSVNARVVGRFHTTGGLGNDIQAVVADQDQCENWINGHRATVLYQSGTVTNGSLNVPIPQGGTYCLAFSNRISIFSSKTISANIALEFLAP